MQNSRTTNYLNKQFRFRKIFKRKVFLSNELKKALFIAFCEAKKQRIFVNVDLLLYGLLSQPTALSSRLFSLTVSQFRNNKKLTVKVISSRLKEINYQRLKEKKMNNMLTNFSSEILKKNEQTPWLTPEVKEILRRATRAALQTQKKIVIVDTKLIFFELLSKEPVRDLLVQLIN